MIKRILSNKVLIRFLRWCFGSALVTVTEKAGWADDEERIKDSMLVILTKEDTGEQQRVA